MIQLNISTYRTGVSNSFKTDHFVLDARCSRTTLRLQILLDLYSDTSESTGFRNIQNMGSKTDKLRQINVY